jgi:hypothetical protein
MARSTSSSKVRVVRTHLMLAHHRPDTVRRQVLVQVPAAELPWLARHPVGERVGEQLRLGKRPMLWSYRPAGLPVGGPTTASWCASGRADGNDHAVIDALRHRRFDGLTIVEPTDEELTTQMPDELKRSRRHLRSILDAADSWRESVAISSIEAAGDAVYEALHALGGDASAEAQILELLIA